MVGVAGRSNGCHTCRKRRIKCDESKPTCQRCEKAGYTCAGYERPLHFRIAVSSAADIPHITLPAIAKHPANRTHTVECSRSSVPASLSLVAFKPDICMTFVLENFVWRSYGHKWLPLAASGNMSPLALQASSALSQSNFGNSFNQPDIKTSGSIQYGQAVRQLIPELSNPTNAGTEALIVPIMILLIRESLLADPRGSVTHVRGLMQLLIACGPERFQQEPLRSAFESCRATLTTVGIISKRRCFLEEDKWQTVPWAAELSTKSAQNHLTDILVTVPGMLEDDAALSQQDDSAARMGLVERVEHQLVKLFTWRWKWNELNPYSVWEESTSSNPTAVPGQNRLFESVFWFSAFERATEIVLYNAVQMWLVGLLWRLTPAHTPAIISSAAQIAAPPAYMLENTTVSPLLLPGVSFSLRDPAIEICRVFEYQCRNVQHSRDSALFYLLPIGLAYSALEREPLYRDWIRAMLNMSPVTRGYVLGQNVMGFGFYLTSNNLQETITKFETSSG